MFTFYHLIFLSHIAGMITYNSFKGLYLNSFILIGGGGVSQILRPLGDGGHLKDIINISISYVCVPPRMVLVSMNVFRRYK